MIRYVGLTFGLGLSLRRTETNPVLHGRRTLPNGERACPWSPEGNVMPYRYDHSESYYGSLKRNMILVMILVSVTPLILISGIILYYFDVSYRERSADHLRVLVKKHAKDVNTFLEANLANIKRMARSFSYEQLSDQGFLADRLITLRDGNDRSIVDLGVVNEAGIQVAYAGPFPLRGADYSDATWFKEALKRDWYISDVFRGLRDLPHFIVAVRTEREGRPWVLRATVDFEAFNSIVENIRIGSTGFAFIVNRNGEFQTKPVFSAEASRKVYVDFLKRNVGHSGQVTLNTGLNDRGDEVLHFMAPLKNGEWLLGYQQDVDDAFSVVHQARSIALIVFLLGVLGILVAAVFLSDRMTKRIREADAQKEMMNEQVIEAGKLASVGELAAGIAHEINNPVAIMVEEAGWIEDLLDDGEIDDYSHIDEFRRSLKQIRKQGGRCKEITHKLLSFARKTDPTQAKIQLNDLVEEVVALCRQRARFENVKIVTNLMADLPEVEIAASEVQQVVLNLINNSLDAMDSQGGTLQIITRTENSNLVLDVSDDGPGIPKANLQRIFDPFFTTKPVGKGTGLGLSICYGIIKKMGGDISVNSAMGVGTAFHVKIPISRGSPQAGDDTAP